LEAPRTDRSRTCRHEQNSCWAGFAATVLAGPSGTTEEIAADVMFLASGPKQVNNGAELVHSNGGDEQV